jgi:prolyl-tRNA synthetase
MINAKDLSSYIEKTSAEIDKNIIKQAEKLFENHIVDAGNKEELKKALENKKIARVGFCSVAMDGEKCAEVIEKETLATVRGTNLQKETPKGKTEKCVICGKKAKEVVYVARAY